MDVAGVTFIADLSGALYWQEQSLLVVSDLHLEKGSSFAARGVLLPPYDTAATLGRLAMVIARHDPRMVIALGDSFHDRSAHDRLSAADRDAIAALQASPQGTGCHTRPLGGAALLCLRRGVCRHAGVWRLYRRLEHSRFSFYEDLRHGGPGRTCAGRFPPARHCCVALLLTLMMRSR